MHGKEPHDWPSRYVAFSPAEAAHIYRDLRDQDPKVHGHRNVSRETHDRIMNDLSLFLEVHFRGSKAYEQDPLFPQADGLGSPEHQ